MPEGRSIAGLDKSKLGLFPARVETLCGLVFVNLDVHADAAGGAGAGPARAARAATASSTSSRAASGTTRQPSNWKIVIDNYNEGYHVPIAHPGLMRLLDYKHYDVEVHDGWVWFEAPLPRQAVVEPAGARLPAPGRRRCPASPTRTGACGAT